MKSLDTKLANIHADPRQREGLHPRRRQGRRHGRRARGDGRRIPSPASALAGGVSRPDARDRPPGAGRHHADVAPAPASVLTIQERLFDNSPRHARRPRQRHDRHPPPAGGTYAAEPSRPFRTATIEQIQSGNSTDPSGSELRRGADLGLYSITPNNDLEFDYATLRRTRNSASRPSARASATSSRCSTPTPAATHARHDLGRFINDLIVRTLAGVPQRAGRCSSRSPTTGRRRWRSWSRYDPHLVAGHPRRLQRHDLRRVQAARRGEEARRPRRAVRPQDQQQRAPADVRPLPARDRGRPDRRRGGGAARTTATWRSWGSSRTGPCPTTSS